jgi:hypothetical protein
MKKIITHPPSSASHVVWVVIFLAFAVHSQAIAALPAMGFNAESIEFGEVQLHSVGAALNKEGQFHITTGQIEFEKKILHENLSLDGTLWPLESEAGQTRIHSSLHSGPFQADVVYTSDSGEVLADLVLNRQELSQLNELDFMPPEIAWLSKGHLDSKLQVRFGKDESGEFDLRLLIEDVAFDSPDGRFAGDSLSVEVEIRADADSWHSPRVSGSIGSGELLLDDFYRDFSAGMMKFSFRAETGSERWQFKNLQVTDENSLVMEGKATLELADRVQLTEIEVNRLELSFPGAYQSYLEPLVAPWTLNGLEVTGQVTWSGEWSGGSFQAGNLEILDLSIVDVQRQRFALTGLDARMQPGNHDYDSKLQWRGLLIGKVNLGSGEAALDSKPGAFAIIEPVRLDVLGGQLSLHELKVLMPGAGSEPEQEPDIRLRLDLEELDMEQLTAAFGWPSFSGKVSGQIPGVQLQDGVLDVEGGIRVDVFDGVIQMDQLRIERPFGVLPSLSANIEVDNLDLQQLTSTFSFGQISGRIDGYVRDLRMLDWQPVAFDGWLGTPDRQKGSKGISRQAVNHLTTLGGGSATTALTSPLMKLFNNFSYKRLGFGCRMQDNVCEVRGVSEDDVSVLIMEGAGVPKITIRAFNRKVDWPQLLAHLVAASGGDDIRIGD